MGRPTMASGWCDCWLPRKRLDEHCGCQYCDKCDSMFKPCGEGHAIAYGIGEAVIRWDEIKRGRP